MTGIRAALGLLGPSRVAAAGTSEEGQTMSSTRRILIVVGLTFAVIVGASLPASATFADPASVGTTTIATGTVAAPGWVSVNDSCTTTTTTVKRTVRTDPVTGVQTQTAYSSTSTSTLSLTNVNSYSSTTVPGPGAYETTTTTVTVNTDLRVTASWGTSGSRGVSGYRVTAHLVDGSTYPMAQTVAPTTTTSAVVDADYLASQPRLSVTTLTTYGWTAATALTRVLSC
jgi:hypothetical protein